jgi:hypothetical protein
METKTSSRRLSAEQTRANALALRLAGANYREIGKALGISHQRAWRAVTEALARTKAITDERATQLREIDARRLEVLTKAVWTRAVQGDTAAIDRAVRLMERRAALLGLDAPRGLQLTGAEGGPLRFATGLDGWDLEALSPEQMRQLREIEATATGTKALATKREGGE